MLKRYITMLIAVRSWHRESRRKKDFDESSKPKDMMRSKEKDSSVRIIHAGGIVELYEGWVRASYVMEKYPRMILARPEVFKQPHESIIGPDEDLMPGQKFYLVPQTTVKKLRRKHPKKITMDVEKTVGGEFDSDESVCSAKDFYISRESWSKCFRRRWGGNQEAKVFKPPIKKPRGWQGLGWQPSLDSVEELSP